LRAYEIIQVAGTQLWLLADKAAYWPEGKALLIADVHFGKAAAYRALGQPVPHGTTASNVRRIERLLGQHEVEHLIFLGDFFHAPQSLAPATLSTLAEWRVRHPALNCLLIRGNHDLRAGDPPPQLGIEVVPEPHLLGPFALRHTPQPEPGHHVLAGHLHPTYRLQGKGRQSLRLPCFVCSDGITLMPAFGDFTGGMDVEAAPGMRIYLADESGIWVV
jgi:DNA ligase-associated metallophosphoesterase